MIQKHYIELLISDFRNRAGAQKEIVKDEIVNSFLSDESFCDSVNSIENKMKRESMKLLSPLELKFRINNIVCGKEVILIPELLDEEVNYTNTITIDHIEGLKDVGGLLWNNDNGAIEGIAEQSGDFKLTLHGVIRSSQGYSQTMVGSLTLAVIPDPKSLWKELEPDPSLPYYKSNTDCDTQRTDKGDLLLYASKRGRSHAHIGSYRDDDGKISVTPNGWSILVVADGAGSCPLSRRGSKVIVDKTIEALLKIFTSEKSEILETQLSGYIEDPSSLEKNHIDSLLNQTLISAVYTAYNTLSQEANEKQNDIKDYSTTLLIALHKTLNNGKHLILSFWVGDGVIAVYNKNHSVKLLGTPDNGEFAGQTRFLDQDAYMTTDRIQFALLDQFTALILATDGVSDPFFHTDEMLEDIVAWDSFWETQLPNSVTNSIKEKTEEELLSWLDFWSTGNHDDRTIAILLPAIDNIKKKLPETIHVEEQTIVNENMSEDLEPIENSPLIDVSIDDNIESTVGPIQPLNDNSSQTPDKPNFTEESQPENDKEE